MKKKKQQPQKRPQQSQRVPTLFDVVVDTEVNAYSNLRVSLGQPSVSTAELTVRMRDVLNSILAQMDNKVREYLMLKQLMTIKVTDLSGEGVRVISAALNPYDLDWRNSTGIVVFSMCVCAETIVKLAYNSGRLKDLFKLIDSCRRALYPYDLRNGVWTNSFDFAIAEIDLVSKQDFSDLVHLLVLAGSDGIYDAVFHENEAKETRKYRKDIIRLLNEVIPSKEAKRGIRLFYGGLASQFSITVAAVERLLEDNEKAAADTGFSISKLFQRETPSSEPARLVAETLAGLLERTLSYGGSMKYDHLRPMIGDGADEPELLLLGLYLAMAEEPILKHLFMVSNVMTGAVFLTNYGYKVASVCSESPFFVQPPGRAPLSEANSDTTITAIAKEVSDLFSFQDELIDSETDGEIKNGQALVAAGLSLLSSTKDKERIEALGNQAAMYLQSIKPASPVVCGALTATYLLCAGKLIKSPEMFHDDRAQFVQAAADAESAKAKAVDQQKAAESALTQSKAEAEQLRAKAAELERLLASRENELKTVYAEKATLQEQTDDLLDLLSQEDAEPVEEEDAGIQLPYDVGNKKILVFGGFPAFINNLQEYIHGAVYIDPARRDAMQIRNADGVMVQLNRIGHPDFYFIVSTCKTHGIPIGYFRTAGAHVCAMQMAKFIDGLPAQN